MAMTGLIDWSICFAYLAGVLVIGLRFAGRAKSTDDYFVGSRKMNWWPIGVSLFATSFSSLSFVGLPREAAYSNYHLFLAMLFIPLWVVPVVGGIFIPIFHKLQLTSVYEYLELRFSRPIRLTGSLLYILCGIVWLGSMLHAIGLIIQVALGLSDQRLIWAVVTIGLLTTVYTVVGGFEAVVWTDVMQAFTLGGSIFLVLLVTLSGIDGGWSTVWKVGWEHHKFDMFHTNLDLTATAGSLFSAAAVGLFSYLAIFTAEQPMAQRSIAMPSVAAARRGVVLSAVVILLVVSLFFAVGTSIYVYYQLSPPQDALPSGLPNLAREDHLLPHFIMNQIRFPGLAGLLVAGLFAAVMSSLSSGINSLTVMIIYDWLPGRALTVRVSRLCAALFGIVVVATALIVPYLGANVYSIIIKFEGTLVGPLLGLFLLGLLFRRANAFGATAGAGVGIAVSVFLVFQGSLSFWWYSAFTCLPTLTAGILFSLLSQAPPPDKLRGLVVDWGGERPEQSGKI